MSHTPHGSSRRYNSSMIVDARSPLLIDDGIGMQNNRCWSAQNHMATTHHFDESPRVLIDQLIRAPAENDVERAL